MVFIPEFQIHFSNGWIPFALYIIIFGITLMSFSKEVRARLYDRSRWSKKQRLFTGIGKIITLINLILIMFSPLNFNSPLFWMGVIIYLLGLLALVIALINYRNTALDVPVTRGLYRISRNPQVFSIWMVFLGICMVIASGLSLCLLFISLVFLHHSIIAEEEACLQQYGEAYENFMKSTSRYFLFF